MKGVGARAKPRLVGSMRVCAGDVPGQHGGEALGEKNMAPTGSDGGHGHVKDTVSSRMQTLGSIEGHAWVALHGLGRSDHVPVGLRDFDEAVARCIDSLSHCAQQVYLSLD